MKAPTRCRPGDLALVIHDEPCCASNIGRFVEVDGPLELNLDLNLPCWLIRPVVRAPYAVTDEKGCSFRLVDWGSLVEHPDAWLLPVRRDGGLSLEETEVYGRMLEQIDRALVEMGAVVRSVRGQRLSDALQVDLRAAAAP